MAIDTLAKRSSALNVTLPWHVTLPLADSSIGQADRQHVAHHYSGILATTVVTPDYQISERYTVLGSDDRYLKIDGSEQSYQPIDGSDNRYLKLRGNQ